MLTPESIYIKNFMSIQEMEYSFTTGKCSLIYGKNMDDDGADSNGSGKTSFINSIKVAILDTTVDKELDKDDYISDWSDESNLIFRLRDDVTNDSLVIKRDIYRGESTKVVLEYKSKKDKEITSGKEANKKILDILGISSEDILNYFIIGQNNNHNFFEATDDAKKKIISRFTNSNSLDKVIVEVEKDLKKTNSDKSNLDSEISNLEGQLTILNEQLEYELNGKQEEQEEKKSEYEEKISELSERIALKRSQVNKITKELKQKKVEIEKLSKKNFDYTKQQSDKEEAEKEYETLSNAITSCKKKLNSLLVKEGGKITCPKCKHSWIPTNPDEDVKKISKDIASLKEEIKEFQGLLSSIEELIEDLDNRIEGKKSLKRKLDNEKSKYESDNSSVKSSMSLIQDLESRKETLETSLKEFSGFSTNEKRIDQLNSSISKVTEEIEEKQKELALLDQRMADLMFWKINFGTKGFKTYLANHVLGSLEGYVNNNLRQFNTNLQVKLNGFRRLKSGELRENIDVLVSRDGDIWKKYRRSSGGQRQRINVCGILTIQRLINLTTKGRGLDLLLLDEFFEGLDSRGQKNVLEILSKSSITTLVVSHNNNDINFPHKIWFNYQNGVTTLPNEQGKTKDNKRKS